jgi:Putative peptidoglycan binding domain
MPANPRPKHREPRLAAAAHQWVARHLLVLGVIGLGSVLAPASASAHSPRHRARATGQVLESAVPTEAQLSRVVLLAPGSGYNTPHGSAFVRALQLRLTAVNAAPGPIDGRYGPLSTLAVERFQTAHRLNIDGIAGPITLAALTAPVRYPRPLAIVRVLYRRPVLGRNQPAPGTTDQAPKTTRVAVPDRRDRPAPKPARKPASELPITPVLLGLLALGLALGSFSYARARHATGKARAPTPLRIRPIRVPHASQAPLGPRGAEHEERQP